MIQSSTKSLVLDVTRSLMNIRKSKAMGHPTYYLHFEVASSTTTTCLFVCLFVCFVALRPKSTAMVIAGRSVHLTTLFPGQA